MTPRKARLLSLAVALSVLGGGYAWALHQYGTVAGLRQRLAGQRLVVANPTAELGTAPKGQPRDFTFRVRNCSGQPVTLLGMRTSCGCVTSAAFPLTIAAGAWHAIDGQIRPTAAGRQVRGLELYSDDPTAGRVAVAVAIVGEDNKG